MVLHELQCLVYDVEPDLACRPDKAWGSLKGISNEAALFSSQPFKFELVHGDFQCLQSATLLCHAVMRSCSVGGVLCCGAKGRVSSIG